VVSARQHDSAGAWAAVLAARLRLIHAGFADEPADQRHAFLADEVERAAEAVAPSQKREYLEALSAQFPAWQTAAAPEVPATIPPSAAGLMGQLLDRLGELGAADRARLAAGLQPELSAAATGSFHLELWKKFGLAAERTPSGERTWRLLGTLLEFFTTLDQLAWTLWRNSGVKSAFWKESDVTKLAGPYLAGDAEVSSEQMRQAVERTRRLIAAILGAPGRAAADVANQQAARLSPEAIEQAARADKRTLESLDAACWREYKQRYTGGATASHVEAAIQAALAQAAENLIGGRTR